MRTEIIAVELKNSDFGGLKYKRLTFSSQLLTVCLKIQMMFMTKTAL